jgi:hypothetical protein
MLTLANAVVLVGCQLAPCNYGDLVLECKLLKGWGQILYDTWGQCLSHSH